MDALHFIITVSQNHHTSQHYFNISRLFYLAFQNNIFFTIPNYGGYLGIRLALFQRI